MVPEPTYVKQSTEASREIPRDVIESVRDILQTVRDDGDTGVRGLTRRFDDVERASLRVRAEEIEQATDALTDAERRTIDNTIENVREFHEEQFSHLDGFEKEFEPGITMGTRLVPVQTAGVYVPGGRHPLVAAPR